MGADVGLEQVLMVESTAGGGPVLCIEDFKFTPGAVLVVARLPLYEVLRAGRWRAARCMWFVIHRDARGGFIETAEFLGSSRRRQRCAVVCVRN